jgi:hypothetical protein
MKQNAILQELRGLNWKAEASLWALFYQGSGEDAETIVRPVKTTKSLQTRLLAIVHAQINRAKNVREYDYQTTDLEDDDALVVTSGRDSLAEIALQTSANDIISGKKNPVSSTDELLMASGYLVRIDTPNGGVIHGFKRMPETVKTFRRLFDVAIHADFELDLTEDDKRSFRLARTVDAFHYKNTTFVTSKKDFETGLRYRDAMRTTAKNTVTQIANSGVIANAAHLLDGREDKYQLLRRLAGIGKNPRFQDPRWLKRVQELNTEHSWNLKFNDEGKLLLDDECLDLILTLLRDRRALTLIYKEMIDAEVSKPV